MNSNTKRTATTLTIALLLAGCGAANDGADADPLTQTSDSARRPDYVGSDACAQCHSAEHAAWLSSHHRGAMRDAAADTVLGDFDDAVYEYNGLTTTFFRDGDSFLVNTDGGDGTPQDFRIAYTFGVEPLQQYLIELPGGRLQALSIAWDSRAPEDGGQRWFHLYAGERIDFHDPLHWTGAWQNWNAMCADCHSTNLVKSFDPESNAFATTFSEINVGCEACHGAGSLHVENPALPPPALTRNERVWVFDAGESIARLAAGDDDGSEIEVCAQCHSRRSQLSDAAAPGEPFLDAYRPALLDAGLYHADGQILDEVYVYGSFMQSAMAAAGVTCSDCHEPHSGALRTTMNAVCSQCHLTGTYDVPEHHHHESETTSASCVSCHMRSETYMVVDPRRDHSFRVPRPDLSSSLGTPNACNDCHDDRTSDWAAARIEEWFPQGRQTEFHYGQALAAGRGFTQDGGELLSRVIQDSEQPAIVRATALSLMAVQPDDRALELIRTSLTDSDPIVRLAALDQLSVVPVELRRNWAQSALTDPLLALRIAAARGLVAVREQLSERRLQDFSEALSQYAAAQRFNSDRAEGLINLAGLAAETGEAAQAEAYFRSAIERFPEVAAAYVNLADLYRAQGRESDATRTLEGGLSLNPDDAGLRLALGLSLVRAGATEEALSQIRQSVALAPDDPYYAYVFGVALNSLGDRAQALAVLRSNNERFAGHRDTLIGLATILRDAGEFQAALDYARSLQALSPSSATARSLIAELEIAVSE